MDVAQPIWLSGCPTKSHFSAKNTKNASKMENAQSTYLRICAALKNPKRIQKMKFKNIYLSIVQLFIADAIVVSKKNNRKTGPMFSLTEIRDITPFYQVVLLTYLLRRQGFFPSITTRQLT